MKKQYCELRPIECDCNKNQICKFTAQNQVKKKK
jgi:hypothetical protein